MEENLNPEHSTEIKKFLDFFGHKRQEVLKEIDISVKQFKDRMNDDVYSKAEVESIISNFHNETKNTVTAELENIVYMTGVYVKILMIQGQKNAIFLSGDTGFLENQRAIEEMRGIEVAQRSESSSKRGAQAGRLPTLSAGFNNDPSIIAKLKETEEENVRLSKKLQDIRAQCVQLTEEKNKLTEAVTGLEFRNEELSKQISALSVEEAEEAHVKEISQELYEAKVRDIQLQLQTKEELLEHLKEEQQKRLTESKQFQSLKKLVQSKNEQMRVLRERLEKYEAV